MTARKPKPHSETAWMPMLKRPRSKPVLMVMEAAWRRRDAIERFSSFRKIEWEELKRHGWRIVKVRISVLTAGQIKAEKGTRR